MKCWYDEFNHGRHSLTDEFRKGRPKSVIGPENINAMQKLIMPDRHVTYCKIETTLGISSTTIYKILHKHLTVKRFVLVGSQKNLTKQFFGDVSCGMVKML